MTKYLTLILLMGFFFVPTTVTAEEFECIECGYTYYAHLHGDSQLPIVTNYKQRGVIRSKSQGGFLDNATYYLEGMLTRPPSDGQYLNFEKGEGKFAIVIMDSDGDLILGYEYGDITLHYLGSGSLLSGEFANGTGKYEGIRGRFELTRYTGEPEELKADLKMHLAEMPPFGPAGWNDHDMCNIITGYFEIEPR